MHDAVVAGGSDAQTVTATDGRGAKKHIGPFIQSRKATNEPNAEGIQAFRFAPRKFVKAAVFSFKDAFGHTGAFQNSIGESGGVRIFRGRIAPLQSLGGDVMDGCGASAYSFELLRGHAAKYWAENIGPSSGAECVPWIADELEGVNFF